jgi:hypothetical protein
MISVRCRGSLSIVSSSYTMPIFDLRFIMSFRQACIAGKVLLKDYHKFHLWRLICI